MLRFCAIKQKQIKEKKENNKTPDEIPFVLIDMLY